jgi:hypothetical protein
MLSDHSPPSNAEVKNVWSYNSTPQYAFMAWCSVKAHGQVYLYFTCVEVCWLNKRSGLDWTQYLIQALLKSCLSFRQYDSTPKLIDGLWWSVIYWERSSTLYVIVKFNTVSYRSCGTLILHEYQIELHGFCALFSTKSIKFTSVYLSIYLSIYLSVCLSIWLSS